MHHSQHFGGEGSGGLPGTAIAIVGMSCRFAGARDLDAYWSLLRGGIEGIATYSDAELVAAGVSPATLKQPDYVRRGAAIADMECFDADLFGLSPRDASIMDPQHRHFLECAWEALENASHDPQRFDGAIGVFAGSGHNAYMPANLLTNPRLVRDVGLFLLRHTGNDKDFLTTRASYLLDLKGPSINVQTACSTSLVAIHMAAQSLLDGECDMALAGGTSIELPHGQGYRFEEGGILSPDGHCRPFDAASEGTVFGSGVAVVVLRRLAEAIEAGDHIYAVIRGSAINNDGAGKVGYLAPSVDGQAQVIAEALDIAGVDAGSIDYVEAHGTGTRVGDPIEVAALTAAFRQTTDATGYCGLGSVKANIGHTDTAAGAASLIKVALAMHHEHLPASLNFDAANPDCAFDASPFRVQGEARAWSATAGRPRRAGVSSLGVGGTNAHVVMEEAPARPAGNPSRAHQLLLCSARSDDALAATSQALGRHLVGHPDTVLADAAYSLSVGRRALPRRRAIVAGGTAEAAAALVDPGKATLAIADRPVAFLFCGAGAQHVDMARGLYDAEPVFRDSVYACLAALDAQGIAGVREALFPDDRDRAASDLERPSIALPALFTIQVSLARFWMALGVRPDGMIGHSSGEYAAAHLAGVLSLDDGLRIVSARGRLFETVAGGGMLSVPLPEHALRPLLPPGVSIAAVNAPRLCVASGPSHAIEKLRAALADIDVESQPVRIAVAAHSAMLDPILAEFRALMTSIALKPPTLRFVSNLTGDWVGAAQATDPEYWVRHLRQTVRFTDGLQRLLGDSDRVLLEVGPGRAMASLARQHPDRASDQPVLSSLRHADQQVDDQAFMLGALGQLWALGVEIDWAAYWADERRLRLPLPTYQFDRKRHWIEPGSMQPAAIDDVVDRHEDIADWFYAPAWSPSPIPTAPAIEAPALVFEDRAGVGAAIAARLRAAGRAVATVRAGTHYRRLATDRFVIAPARAADYARLFDDLADAGLLPGQVHHCWLVTAHARPAALDELGFRSLMLLAPALAQHVGEAPITIALVSDHLYRVTTETGLVPQKATALGPCGVIPAEYPNLSPRSIDIALSPRPAPAELDAIAADLIADLATPHTGDAIAWRAGERWTRRFERRAAIDLPAPALWPGGLYLITGGLGGLGLAIAQHLAETCEGRLALVTRTALPPRAQWPEILARSSRDPVADKIRKLLAIEATGAQVEVVAADVCDRRAMRRMVRDVTARMGPITGVFHAAGTLDDGLIETRSAAASAVVMAPKVAGTLALDAALRDHPPEFLLLFSSISAFAGLPGQADYAAANSFLDAFAQAHRDHPHTRVVSVGWSQWRDIGMAAAADRAAPEAPPELPGPGSPIDHPLIDRLHMLAPESFVATALCSPDTDWLLDEHRVVDGDALIPGTGHLEIARAAFAAVEQDAIDLADVTFLAPFAVPDGKSRELRFDCHRRGGSDWSFSILGRAAGDDAGWTQHVSGLIRPHTPGDAPPPIDPAAIEARCAAAILPASSQTPMLAFGPRWDTVKRLSFGHDEALIHLELGGRFAADCDTIGLHPALMDLATAGAQSLIRDFAPSRDFYAPLAYRRIRVHAPVPPAICSHIRYRPPTGDARMTATFDITIAAPDGRVLVEISEFTMIRLRDPALLSALPPAAPATPAARAGTVAADPLAGLVASEGLAVIDRILTARGSAHLVVSPYPLDAAIARLRKPRRTAAVRRSTDGEDASPPLNEAERTIADLWQDLLGIDQIRATDDFFDLGGHSLLAVQFINRLRKQTGKTLPLAALLDTPTVQGLARLLDPEGATTSEGASDAAPDIVTIRPGRAAPPLFLIHDGLGETLLYRGLAMRLDAGRPVYGIEPRRTAQGAYAHTAIAEMASDYAARIRQAQPHGPYLLGGLCAGGVIAFEIARQLQDTGETTALVAIIDAADVAAPRHRFYITRSRLRRVRASLGGFDAATLPLLAQKVWNAAVWEVSSRLDWLQRRRTVRDMQQGDGAARPKALPFLHLYEVAHRAHEPQGRFAGGDIVLLRASAGNGEPDDIPYREVYSDCALGWGKRVVGDVAVVPVPGGHSSALQEPHVAVLAMRVQEAIDSAMAGHESWPQGVPAVDAAPADAPEHVVAAE